MVLRQEGSRVEGTYGQGGGVEGKAARGKLEITWSRGRGSGGGEFELAKGGRSFTGKWNGGGGGGTWRGWKKDPEAEKGKSADFSGVWLSSLGTMRLEQKGEKVSGTYGSDGRGEVEGEVRGRRVSLRCRRIRWSGEAWLEMTKKGDRLFGLVGSKDEKWLAVRIDDFVPDAKPKAGKIVKGLSSNLMCLFLRAPKGWKRGRKTDAIILLHGSNWTTKGMTWVTAKNWPEIGKRFFLVGIQGERWADWSDHDDLRHNYSYVNWTGRSTFRGYPYTDRESPWLVHEVVKELKEKHRFDRVFVVGHSQGEFLAYYLYMHYPETFAGVAPLSCGMTFQCEPSAFDDEDLLVAQRATPLAMVHGTKDAQWGPETGDDIYDRFAASGFPALRYFRPSAGHGYDFLPIGEAVAWLDALSTPDAKALVAFAEESAEKGRWRDVAAALVRADEIRSRSRLKDVEARDFLAWREEFEFAPAARETMKAFERLRDEHDEPAEKLIGEARAAFRSGDRDGGWAKYEEIVEKYDACRNYRIVKRWLKDR
jgi:predicted esterase